MRGGEREIVLYSWNSIVIILGCLKAPEAAHRIQEVERISDFIPQNWFKRFVDGDLSDDKRTRSE